AACTSATPRGSPVTSCGLRGHAEPGNQTPWLSGRGPCRRNRLMQPASPRSAGADVRRWFLSQFNSQPLFSIGSPRPCYGGEGGRTASDRIDRSDPFPGRGGVARSSSSSLLVGLDVPAGLDGGVQGAVGLLWPVGELDLGVVQAELIGGDDGTVARAAGLEAADQQVRHLDGVELLLLLAGLAAD